MLAASSVLGEVLDLSCLDLLPDHVFSSFRHFEMSPFDNWTLRVSLNTQELLLSDLPSLLDMVHCGSDAVNLHRT